MTEVVFIFGGVCAKRVRKKELRKKRNRLRRIIKMSRSDTCAQFSSLNSFLQEQKLPCGMIAFLHGV